MDKVTVITYPDYYHDQSFKALLINTTAEERTATSEWLLKHDIGMTLYFYNNDSQIEWLLNVTNQVDTVYINVDNSSDLSYHYISYLVSLPNTIWNSQLLNYSIINRGKVSNINEYMERNWLG
jgi:hypothetical protein